MYVIFLDVDGVLVSGQDIGNNKKLYPNQKNINVYDHFPDRSLKLLSDLVNKTGADVVLSSTIRLGNMFGKDYMGGAYDKLKNALAKYGVHINDITALIDGYDETEINDYLSRHPEIEDYVIINDEDFPSQSEHLLRTDFNTGLTKDIVREAQYRLLTARQSNNKKNRFIDLFNNKNRNENEISREKSL